MRISDFNVILNVIVFLYFVRQFPPQLLQIVIIALRAALKCVANYLWQT